MAEIRAAAPAMARVLERRPDGSGVVEIPVAAETPYLDGSRTETGQGPKSIPLSALQEMVDNFPSYPGPIGVGVGTHLRDTSGPSPGFVDGLELRGSTLWARLDLGPALFDEVVNQRAWRGFSIEAVRDLEKPTVEFKGWVLTGGIFTNAPALDVHYQIAAAAGTGSAQPMTATLRLSVAKENEAMAEEKTISLASHEAKLAEVRNEASALKTKLGKAEDELQAATERCASLQAELDQAKSAKKLAEAEATTAKAEANRYEAQINGAQAEIRALRLRANEAEAELKDHLNAAMVERVKARIAEAVEAGIKPATFDGWEADPAAYVDAKFGSYEAFDNTVGMLLSSLDSSGKNSIAAKSGHDPKKAAEESAANEGQNDEFAKVKATLASKGIDIGDVDFTDVTTEEEAKARLAAASK